MKGRYSNGIEKGVSRGEGQEIVCDTREKMICDAIQARVFGSFLCWLQRVRRAMRNVMNPSKT